jgi:site-specific recombinase XerD
LPSRIRSLGDVTIGQIDAYLEGEARRGWSRDSLHALGSSLRSFFRYAAQQGWCSSSLALGIDLPRLYALGEVPKAPTVDEVNRLLRSSLRPPLKRRPSAGCAPSSVSAPNSCQRESELPADCAPRRSASPRTS